MGVRIVVEQARGEPKMHERSDSSGAVLRQSSMVVPLGREKVELDAAWRRDRTQRAPKLSTLVELTHPLTVHSDANGLGRNYADLSVIMATRACTADICSFLRNFL